MISSKNDSIKYIIGELILLTFLGISQYFGMAATNLGIVFIMLSLFPFLPGKLQAESLLIAMPFFNMFSYKIGTTSLYYIFMILYSIQYLWRQRFKISQRKFICFFLSCLCTFTIFNMEIWGKWALRFWIMVLLFNNDELNRNLANTIRFTSVSAILSSIIGYLMQINGKSIYTGGYVYIQGTGATTRFAGLIGDPVFYGQFIAVLIAANLVMAYQNKEHSRFSYIVTVIMAIFALLSFSKTAILLIVLEYTGYLIVLAKENAGKRRTILKSIYLIGVLCIAIALLYQYVVTHTDSVLVQGFVTRFASNDLWTGRGDISKKYLEWLCSNWLYWLSGMPYSQYTKGIAVGSNLITRTHNIFLETACLFGVIPAVIILLCLCYYFFKLQSKYQLSIIVYLPLLALLASGFSLHGHFEWHYYFLWSIAFACVQYNISRKDECIYEVKANC